MPWRILCLGTDIASALDRSPRQRLDKNNIQQIRRAGTVPLFARPISIGVARKSEAIAVHGFCWGRASPMNMDVVIPVAMVVKNMVIAVCRWFKRG